MSRPSNTWLAVIGGIVAAAVLVVVMFSQRDAPRTDTSASAPGVSHVHGLGINPGDGELYAATHHGVFRIPAEGEAALVSVPRDTMGFTVVGADRFLGSGHPAFQGDPLFDEDERPLLGLIESTDAGRTWEALSLFGEVDFHSLEAAHGAVYGYDSTSGRFMVSDDGETWDVRSEGIGVYDFAVDPHDADHLIAASDSGLAESIDGGRTWERARGPDLVFLAWDDDGLWGVHADGTAFADAGASWEERGNLPGAPQALLAAGGELYAAASEGDRTGIYVSVDGGKTWQLRYQDRA